MRKILFFLCLFLMNFRLETKQAVITNLTQFDGFGSQFQTIIASVIYAELNNETFVYTPFEKMAHNYDNDHDFLEKKENLINFIGNFDIFDSNKHYINNPNMSNIVYFKNYFDRNVIKCANSLSLKKLKNIFRANKNKYKYFNNENVNIAIHIRRPNPHDNRIEGTNTPDSYFLNIINKLKLFYDSIPLKFHIYSQGNKNDFKKTFTGADIVFHINESIEDTFTAMVLADILVTGVTSFSYTAGLLSEGIVYYIPFWHTPLPHWISVNTLS